MSEDDMTEAQRAAKLALLRHIASTVEQYHAPSYLREMAHAYALVVGAAPGRLPGAPAEVVAK
jgi:hypothetical protein